MRFLKWEINQIITTNIEFKKWIVNYYWKSFSSWKTLLLPKILESFVTKWADSTC